MFPFGRTARSRLSRLFLAALFSLTAFALSARAGDTVVLSDGTFGPGWVSTKIVDTTPGALATFTSTTLLSGPAGAYRETSHTYTSGSIVVGHTNPAYTHQPALDPICKIDFAADLVHFTGVSVGGLVWYRLAILQGGTWYGGPNIDVYSNSWTAYSQVGLRATDFFRFAGNGPEYPDFACSGGAMQFGFISFNGAVGGPWTKVSGLDNWLVTLHVARTTFSDGTLLNHNWIPVKVVDTTPGASATTSSASFLVGGNPADYRQTTHTYTSGAIVVAHLYGLGFHDPSVEPVYTVDFSAHAQHQTAGSIGGAVGLRAAVWQGTSYYGGPTINVFNGTWGNYATNGLTASDFVKLSGPGPNHPDFTNSGSLLQFGYATSNSASGGPTTKQIGVDNWIVRANLNPPCPGTLGIPVCFGDDITNPCPCYPTVPLGAAGHGCPNSIDPAGGLLVATGTASLANDTAILHGSHMPSSFCLYFQGTLVTGIPFGDGRLCAGGTIVRLAVKLNICNASQYPSGAEPSLSVQGLVTAPGQRIYQLWYRDAAAFCTSATYNLSNALAVNWTL
ncbi:MAG: hypothetical protein JNL28_13800 [Planctomycetes bacterium]|nr:hypothetical protein [Planctomycetota bacterium]